VVTRSVAQVTITSVSIFTPSQVSNSAAPGKTVTVTIPDLGPGGKLCMKRYPRPGARAADLLPLDYTWGCPPKQLCFPKGLNGQLIRSACRDEPPPDPEYICQPEECIPAPPLAPAQYCGEKIFGQEVCKNYYDNYPYFNLDPRKWGLDFSIFSSNNTFAKRQAINNNAVSYQNCYDDCNNALVEAEAVGKGVDLCAPDSPFNTKLSACKLCLNNDNPTNGLQAYVDLVSPDLEQFTNYCVGEKPGGTVPLSTIVSREAAITATVTQTTVLKAPSVPTSTQVVPVDQSKGSAIVVTQQSTVQVPIPTSTKTLEPTTILPTTTNVATQTRPPVTASTLPRPTPSTPRTSSTPAPSTPRISSTPAPTPESTPRSAPQSTPQPTPPKSSTPTSIRSSSTTSPRETGPSAGSSAGPSVGPSSSSSTSSPSSRASIASSTHKSSTGLTPPPVATGTEVQPPAYTGSASSTIISGTYTIFLTLVFMCFLALNIV